MTRDELFALPAVTDLVTAGRAWGLGRTKAYQLAEAGEFPCPVQRLGRCYHVVTEHLLASLGISSTISGPDESEGRCGELLAEHGGKPLQHHHPSSDPPRHVRRRGAPGPAHTRSGTSIRSDVDTAGADQAARRRLAQTDAGRPGGDPRFVGAAREPRMPLSPSATLRSGTG